MYVFQVSRSYLGFNPKHFIVQNLVRYAEKGRKIWIKTQYSYKILE